MKISSVVSYFILLIITVTASNLSNSTSAETRSLKTTEKMSYPKKVNSSKKNLPKTSLQKIANITEKFKDLPDDDLAFIKELDRQFKLHGGKIKIKLERGNVTETKSSKRTIDGELGYGYAQNGYDYNPPKFMFYPYSQQNIGTKQLNQLLTGDRKTEVSIEPSYSYELKSQTYITQNEPQIDVPKLEHQQPEQLQLQQHQNYEEPVIVLRIPGPAKYATHLQMLLQKYLEIRAAQYLCILEESEHKNIQLQPLDYQQINDAVNEAPVVNVQQSQPQVDLPGQFDYHQQVQYDHQTAVTPQPIQYPEIDNVYHNYKHRHLSQPEQVQQIQQGQDSYYTPQHIEVEQHQSQYQQQEQHQPQYQQQQAQHQYQSQEQQQSLYQQKDPPQFYYTQQQYAQSEAPTANTYQHVYLLAMAPQGHSDYDKSHDQLEKQQSNYMQDQPNQNEHSQSLLITENNPGPLHTKVTYNNNNNEQSNQNFQMYQLPSIKPNERHPPSSIPNYHQDFQQQFQDSREMPLNHQQHYNTTEPTTEEVVAITQKPYNYHAHNVKARARGRTAHKRRGLVTKEADHGLQKIREYVQKKLGAETGSGVEFKTTQAIEQ